MKLLKIFALLFVFLIGMSSCDSDNKDLQENTDTLHKLANNSELKILAVGNSFTDDATRYLPHIIDAFKEYDVFVAKLTKGGSSLKDHWDNFSSSSTEYEFFYNGNSIWAPTNIKTINEAIELTDWDYVVLQQVSGSSGNYETYQPYLDNLISAIKDHNPDTKIVWHMTWAYSSDKCDREIMYKSISDATEKVNELVDLVVPSGKVIEDFRNSEYNDENDLTRDGFHLNKKFPCFALSCLWHEYLITPYTHESCLSGNEGIIDRLISKY